MPPSETRTPERGAALVALTCEQCGGGFDFRALEATAVCPYCQHAQALPPELLAQSAGYAADVDAAKLRADFHALVAARYEAMQPAAWLGVVVGGAVTVTAIAAMAVAFFGRAGGITAGGLLAIGGLVAVFAASATLTRVRTRMSERQEAVTSFASPCPSCGGANELTIGQTLASCTYCGVPLVPGERLAAIGLGLAEAQTRASKLNAVAASRQFRLVGARRNRLLGHLTAIVSPVLPAIIAIYSYQQYELGLGERSQVMAAGFGTLIFLIAPFAAYGVRQTMERPLQRALTAITSRPGAARLAGVEGTIAWLSGLWPDEFGEYYDLQSGPGYHAIATSIRGFPVLVAVSRGKFLHIAVAASNAGHKVSHDILKGFGFQVKVCESGAIASLRGKALANFGDPSEGQRLDHCVHATVEALILEGARPAARC